MAASNPFDFTGPPRGAARGGWQGTGAVPRAAELPACPGVRWSTIQAAQRQPDGAYAFQHGVHLVRHAGAWLASWAVNLSAENTGGEFVWVRRSEDDGCTWHDHSRLTPPVGIESLSHGVMLVHAGRLHAWLAAFDGYLQGVHTRHYTWGEAEARWEEQGAVIGEGFWPLQEPQGLADGTWLMAGFIAEAPRVPAVALAATPNAARWRVVRIKPSDTGDAWGESNVLVRPDRVINLSRHGPTRRLHWAESRDAAHTWTPAEPTDLPFADTKPCTGVLPDGRPWLIGTCTADTVLRRDPLTLALGEPGRDGFTRLWCLRPAVLAGETAVASHPAAALSYPHAVEHDGNLYVAYSNSGGRRGANLNSIELAVVPLADLGE